MFALLPKVANGSPIFGSLFTCPGNTRLRCIFFKLAEKEAMYPLHEHSHHILPPKNIIVKLKLIVFGLFWLAAKGCKSLRNTCVLGQLLDIKLFCFILMVSCSFNYIGCNLIVFVLAHTCLTFKQEKGSSLYCVCSKHLLLWNKVLPNLSLSIYNLNREYNFLKIIGVYGWYLGSEERISFPQSFLAK